MSISPTFCPLRTTFNYEIRRNQSLKPMTEISRYDLPFKESYKPQFTQNFFEIVAIARRKRLIYTPKDEQGEILRGKVFRRKVD